MKKWGDLSADSHAAAGGLHDLGHVLQVLGNRSFLIPKVG